MNLKCERCEAVFDAVSFRGYCDECISHFKGVAEKVNASQRPEPNVFADGKFTDEDTPGTVYDPVAGRNVCGMCGGEDIEPGYGLGAGRGMGSYNFCCECNTFLDFSEDTE